MERDSSRYLDDEGTLRYMRVYQYYRSLIEEKKSGGRSKTALYQNLLNTA